MDTSRFWLYLVLSVVGILVLILVPTPKNAGLLLMRNILFSLLAWLLLGLGIYGLVLLKRRYAKAFDAMRSMYDACYRFFDRPVFFGLWTVLLLGFCSYVLVIFDHRLQQQYTDWRLLGVPSTGSPVELARYAHRADCLEAREAAIRRAWTERQQLPNLECAASVGWWERLYKFLNSAPAAHP